MRYAAATTLAIALAFAAAACHDTDVPGPPSTVPASITDTFTGTLAPAGTSAQPFTVVETGHLTVTLNSVTPSAAVGIGIGSPSAGGCAIVSSKSPVQPGATVALSGIALKGNLCLSVFDVGNLVDTVTYTVTVFHS
ncbi:MAG TPA: hypothetical protein VL309_05355 [Vicinamibacterales bacterium]|jgi:hypothetical protein|nr:hypothetical protein [Vicinamibacterales bacterium]